MCARDNGDPVGFWLHPFSIVRLRQLDRTNRARVRIRHTLKTASMHVIIAPVILVLATIVRRAFTSSPLTTSTAKAAMAARATGTFDVRLNPQPSDESGVGRLTIDKQFHGNLEGTSKGHMLAYSTEVQGSAGY